MGAAVESGRVGVLGCEVGAAAESGRVGVLGGGVLVGTDRHPAPRRPYSGRTP
ncbi:hypothetical protein ACSDR0_08425 [Streptosporangium sp. G11]|uniref:hypothetical protein n=1 Tax=Streptosporangium sp. G11 TaxID=3436926 RepID=UPI003EB8A98F